MPKVKSYAPAWLCRPSPGASIFTSNSVASPSQDTQVALKSKSATGATRTIAKRGNEVFVVVENEIRWSNLARVKDQWQQQQARQKKAPAGQPKPAEDNQVPSYRVSSGGTRLRCYQSNSPSPNGAFLAIVTEHTVHIAVLPDPSHLSSQDTAPIRLKTYQLGPTTHVIPESPVVSALWHPLGLHTNLGGCIVTVTADAAVRVWELDRNNHWSFDQPTLAIDLQKLVDGTSSDQDFAPTGFGKNKGFSADIYDMEVASSCFAGTGNEKEDAWAPMTLWVAMRPGDLYALCPLLPAKWQAPSATIPALSSAIVPKLAALEETPEDLEEELTACRQQYEWLREIDDQEPLDAPSDSDTIQGADVFTRPANPSVIPRLQGPFRFETGDELDDLDLCDILAECRRLDDGEEEELASEVSQRDKLSGTVICLTSGNGRVHICLELDGVEGQWLPKARKNTFRTPLSEPADLVLLESLDTVRDSEKATGTWPTFTRDVHSRYSFFVTNATTVTSFSMTAFVQRLEDELQTEDVSGSGFRMQVLFNSNVAKREQILRVSEADITAKNDHLATSVVFFDYDLGYLLLTHHPSNPYAAVMEEPTEAFSAPVDYGFQKNSPVPGSPALRPRRAPYQVPAILYAQSPLDSFVERHVPHRQRSPIPATLDLVTTAHRVLSSHTNSLERAASDLFLADRIKGTTSEIGEDGRRKEGARNGEALNKRLDAARDRQAELAQRYDVVRKKLLNSGGRPLSDKEKSWINEVNLLSESFDEQESNDDKQDQALAQRLETVKQLAGSLISETKSIMAKVPSPTEPSSPSSPGGSQPRVPQRLQRAKVADAMRMVERESAVIDAITSRLERLNTSM
ncbi:hypothetical protein N7450_004261 [Penicillium hetheringtonii]|uniref:Nuclear pore complex protein An-Nup82 n=1 Tax=Penicillium hetheringtonii TaxID=911720 RepID=A0AAD6DR53_9EURO|nr:hypothetical protein N7450_004261 [Penicillium hetheringtonii]